MNDTTNSRLKNPPLLIDSIRIPEIEGLIGITSCPGVRDDFIFDIYNESLADDLLAIRAWGAAVVVTLLEKAELHVLGVSEIGKHVVAHNMVWLHLPVRNMGVPKHYHESWHGVVPCLCNLLRRGQRIVLHSKEGIGRSAVVAASLLIELGVSAEESLSIVRKARPGSLILSAHEEYCHSLAMTKNVAV